MGLLNKILNRSWLVGLIFLAGLIIGIGAGPLILSFAAKNIPVAQAVLPVKADRDHQTIQDDPGRTDADQASPEMDSSPGNSAGTTTDQAASNLPAPPQTVSIEVDESQIDPNDLNSYQGMPAGFTVEGYPYLGDPDATVTLEEFSDFLCPFCGRHFSQTLPSLIEKYVQSGQVQYVFRDVPLVGLHPTAPQGHVAAHCVAEQGAAYFWLMHDELFKRQQEWSRLPDPTGYLTGLAGAMGIDMAAFRTCLVANCGRRLILVQNYHPGPDPNLGKIFGLPGLLILGTEGRARLAHNLRRDKWSGPE